MRYEANQESKVRRKLGELANKLRVIPIEAHHRIYNEAVHALNWEKRTQSGKTGLGGSCDISEETEGGRFLVLLMEGRSLPIVPQDPMPEVARLRLARASEKRREREARVLIPAGG